MVLPARAGELYAMYLSPRRHAAITGHPVDSTLVLRFTPKGKRGRIDLTHVNVPTHDYRGVSSGWKKYYWRPWRKFLTKSAKPRT